MPTCNGCGKKIIWGKTKDGTKVPLDPAPPVYRFEEGFLVRVDAAVTHFATCADANRFSRRKPSPQMELIR